MDYLEILKFINNKDKKGLETLYTSYGEKFFSFAIDKWHLSEDDAWNVIYKTLETLILKLPDYKFESKKHFENFIFKVFTNFLRQYFRSARKHQSDVLFVSMNQNINSGGNSENGEDLVLEIEKKHFSEYYKSGIIDNPKLIALQKGLDKLDETDKDLLLLRAQNFTYDEIAKFLKTDNNQLKVRHYRAIQKLLKIIDHL